MDNYKVYSFDIFDTLLLRPYADPQEVWSVLEEREQARGFSKARKNADAMTFKRAVESGGETSIEEAYDLIPPYRYLMQKEMELEREILRANPEMLKLWNELGLQGKRRIIVSDMYLPADFIKKVLREKGFDGWDAFYLSRDYNVRKSTGKLFEAMLKAEKVKPEEVCHIGDNPDSDVKQPEALGIHTRYYQKVVERLYEEYPFAKHINARLAGALALGWHQFRIKNPNFTYWHRVGFMMGGVLGYLYVNWIVNTAKDLGINCLLFIARDGYIWEKICNELFPNMPTEYIYAPRITSIAALGAIGSDPWAIKDRRNYIQNHLFDKDTNAISEDYKSYIKRFSIDNKTAIVDGCSSGFSAQRLIEHSIGHEVFCFYLLAMAKKHCAAALFSTKLYSLPWQMLSEFLFGAPEKPIKMISQNNVIYEDNISEEEQFKISVSHEIAAGAIACAKILYHEDVNIKAMDWLLYVDSFMLNLTAEDESNLVKAKNAPDVEQKFFNGVMYKPNYKKGLFVTRQGPRSFIIQLYTTNHYWSFSFSRKGIIHHHINKTIQIGEITSYNKQKSN